MATGITIDEVTNTLDDIQGTEKIPVSSGISEPEVVTTGDLKDYINDGMQEEISDLSTIRSGASAGATAYQKPSSGIPSTDLASAVQTSLGKADTALQSFTETDPTVPSWAKQSSKPSYTAGEVGAVPTTRTVNGKSLSSNIALTASDVEALPSSTVIPDVSGFITNTVDDLVYYYTKSQTYSQTEVQQLINAVKQFTYELVSVLPAASASTMNKIYLVPSSDPQTQNIKDEYITLESSGSYSWEQIGSTAIDLSDYVTTTALNTALADYTTSTDLSTLLAGYQTKIDSTHKLDYSLIDNTPTIPTALSSFTDDLGSNPTHTHSQYLTQHQDISGKADKVTSATNGNFAALDSNGNLTDSGHKHSDYLTSHQDLSNYVQKSNTTGLLKNDGSVDTNTYLTSAPVTSVNGQTGAVSIATGETNVIESVTFNGTAATITNKTAAITATIPTITFRQW